MKMWEKRLIEAQKGNIVLADWEKRHIKSCMKWIDHQKEVEGMFIRLEKMRQEAIAEAGEVEEGGPIRQLPDGTIIYRCEDCPHCTRVKEAGIPFDDDDEDYYGMVGGCGMSVEVFYECFHPDNNEELLDKWDIEEMVDESCPLKNAPENTPEEEDE